MKVFYCVFACTHVCVCARELVLIKACVALHNIKQHLLLLPVQIVAEEIAEEGECEPGFLLGSAGLIVIWI